MDATGVFSSWVTALMKESCCSLRRISRTRKIVFRTIPAMISRKKMTPRIASTPVRQLRTTQLTLSATARATRQIPRTVKKITDRRRPLIIQREYRNGQPAERRISGRSGGFLRGDMRHLRDLQIADEADGVEELERDPGDVELVPREPMTRRHRVRVMVVVPAFAKRQQRDPPAVA